MISISGLAVFGLAVATVLILALVVLTIRGERTLREESRQLRWLKERQLPSSDRGRPA